MLSVMHSFLVCSKGPSPSLRPPKSWRSTRQGNLTSSGNKDLPLYGSSSYREVFCARWISHMAVLAGEQACCCVVWCLRGQCGVSCDRRAATPVSSCGVVQLLVAQL